MQVLPKDKKQKEEKTKILGQATLDLLPYVLGSLPPCDTRALPLHPITDDTSLTVVEDKVRGVWCLCDL
jgi:hypothetical protein